MTGPGILLVLAEPASTLEEEFNDWYDTEHLPERAAVPGVLTARRWRSPGDGPRHAALYDLECLSVLDGAAYRAVSGENFSPWTRRLVARVHPERMVARRIEGDGATRPCSRLLLVRMRAAGAAALAAFSEGCRASLGSAPGLVQLRLFEGVEPEPDFLLALAGFAGNAVPPLEAEAFGPMAGRLDLVATYRP